MKYAIISDIHANLEALTAVLEAIERTGADQVLCLGDVVGYNTNPNECAQILRDRGIPTILGNHDAVACGLEEPWGFNPIALEAALWTREGLNSDNVTWLMSLPDALNFGTFVAVHGAPRNHNQYLFTWEDILAHLPFLEEQNCNVCMIGHTHTPAIFSSDGVYTVDGDSKFSLGDQKGFFINPGSVGQPRDGSPMAAFGLLDTDTNVYEQMRTAYPVEEAARKIVDAGLPRFLAERLPLGR